MSIVDVAPGLWFWRTEQPAYDPDPGLDRWVTSVCAHAGDQVAVLDPIASEEAYARLDSEAPTLALVLKPDHVRDIDAFVERYGCRAMGPPLFWPDGVPRTKLEALDPGMELPGGLRTLYDGRGRAETPMWLPEHRTLVFADALCAPGGELRVWGTPWHEERVLPALRAMLDLPFERVILSHGEPLHDRAAFERALAAEPYAELE